MTNVPTTTSNYRAIGDTTQAVYEAEFARTQSPMLPTASATWAAARPHSALFLAQAFLENQYETTGHIIKPHHHNPVSLRPWMGDPRGMPPGSTGTVTAPDSGQFLVFASDAACAKEWRRRLFDDPNYKDGIYRNAVTLEQMLNIFAPPGDVHPVTGVDNAHIEYAKTVRTMLTRFAAMEAAPEEEPPMVYKAHTWPGLSNPVYLPDTLKASVQLISSSVAGWTAGTKSTRQTTFTQHFTGNMNSSAASERKWVMEGGRRDVPGSYQLIVDGTQVIVTQRFDEMAGHAANNTGNFTSFASEMAIHGGYEAAFQNAAHVAAGVIVAMDWEVDTALLQHWHWLRANGTQKNCPSIIRDKGDWSRFVATVTRNAAAIRAHLAGGESPAPTPAYASPAVIPELDLVSKSDGLAPSFVDASGTRWFWVGDRVKVRTTTGRFQRASKDAARIGPDLKVGEEFDVDWITDYEGAVWFYTPYGTRIAGSDVERTSDMKGEAA